MKMSRRSGRLAILVGALSLIGIWPSANANAQEPAPRFKDERCVLAGYTLKEGQDFREVPDAKDALEELGYQPRKAGGSKTKFDKRMVKVVKEWERHYGRPEDGKLDEGDQILLLSLAWGCRDVPGPAQASSQGAIKESPFPDFGAVNDDYTRGMQQKLRDLCYPIAVDGDFGNQTLNAITAFQRARGLTDDGKVDFLLEEELDLAIESGFCAQSAPTTGRPQQTDEPIEGTERGDEESATETNEPFGCDGAWVLERGDHCENVGELQRLLAGFGCYASHQIDNDFGPGTEWSVREFQRVNDLSSERNGRAGSQTLSALNRGPGVGVSCGTVDADGGDRDCDRATIDFIDVFENIACTFGGNDDVVEQPSEVNDYFDVASAILGDVYRGAEKAANAVQQSIEGLIF